MFIRVILLPLLLCGFAGGAMAATSKVMFDDNGPFAVIEGPAEWRSVSRDTCTPEANCTAEWAFGTAAKLGLLPEDVARETIRRFKAAEAALADDSPDTNPDWHEFKICNFRGFMSFAHEDSSRYFAGDIRATFQECPVSYGWIIQDSKTGIDYQVVQVKQCRNYGGRVLPRKIAGLDTLFDLPVPVTNPLGSELTSLVSWETPSTWGGTTPPGGGGCVRNCEPAPIPLPESLWLLLAGLAMLGVTTRRRHRLA